MKKESPIKWYRLFAIAVASVGALFVSIAAAQVSEPQIFIPNIVEGSTEQESPPPATLTPPSTSTETSLPPTPTTPPPTATPIETFVPPTATLIPPSTSTETSLPPTLTTPPPTASPTETFVPPTATPVETATPTSISTATPDEPSTGFGNGTWRIGIDIDAGTYRTEGTDSCYWERVSDLSGTFGSIIANANPRGPAIVTIAPTDVGFTSQNCGTWVPAETVQPEQPSTQFGMGTWRVGIDIVAGTYRTEDTESCYWERLSDFSGTFGSIIANDNPRGSAIVTIAPTDTGFNSQRCGTWVPADTVQPEQPATQFGMGTWRVGIDIVAGTYRTEDTESCYWERLSDFSGTFSGIIANDNPRGPAIVTIAPTDTGFNSQRCGTWVLADTVQPEQPATQFGMGTWRVGIDIVAGTYETLGGDNCYWERLSGFSGAFSAIIENGLSSDPTSVTILASDAGFQSNRCEIWMLIE